MPGLWFEEFRVGQIFKHPMRRTVTETDNVLFTAMTHNPAALHLDEDYMNKNSEFKTRIVNSGFTLALMVGISVGDTTLGTTVGNLGWDEVRFPRPVFHGDTLRVESEVLSTRPSKSRKGQGVVEFLHRAYNQRGELVASCKRSSSSSSTGSGADAAPSKRRKGRDGRATSPSPHRTYPTDTSHQYGSPIAPYRPVERWLRSPSPALSFLSTPGETLNRFPSPSPEPPLYEDPEEDFDAVSDAGAVMGGGDHHDLSDHPDSDLQRSGDAWYYHPRTAPQDSGVDMDTMGISIATERGVPESSRPSWEQESITSDPQARMPFTFSVEVEVEMNDEADNGCGTDPMAYVATWRAASAGSTAMAMDMS
ncbi:hypothetical protein HDU93_003784 [Gonapodya sp. JEL0774]|nr:hypothetical protein HDU93_003784 [Gonapodya sp. JEL0774]